jgi:hypothetical protein
MHPTDSDVIYVIAEHRAKEQTPMMFAAAVKPWGDWLPWAWPHDGHQSGGKFGAQDQQIAAGSLRHGSPSFQAISSLGLDGVATYPVVLRSGASSVPESFISLSVYYDQNGDVIGGGVGYGPGFGYTKTSTTTTIYPH